MFDGPLDIGEYLALESAMSPKSHVGVLPSGEFTVPAKTPRNSKAAHFKLKFIEHVKVSMCVHVCVCMCCSVFVCHRPSSLQVLCVCRGCCK